MGRLGVDWHARSAQHAVRVDDSLYYPVAKVAFAASGAVCREIYSSPKRDQPVDGFLAFGAVVRMLRVSALSSLTRVTATSWPA